MAADICPDGLRERERPWLWRCRLADMCRIFWCARMGPPRRPGFEHDLDQRTRYLLAMHEQRKDDP